MKRRDFLKGLGCSVGSVAIGAFGCTGRGGVPREAIAEAEASGEWIAIPTREFYGDGEELLAVDPSWHLTVHEMAGHDEPVLGAAEIKKRLESPVGSKRLADLAAGKKTAVVTFDDLSRATPAHEVLPYVIDELVRGGIAEEDILLLLSSGSHRALSQTEVARKVGKRLAARLRWKNHNAYENLTEIGVTSRKNTVLLNRHFVEADLRVTVSGIKAHPHAGYSGGAKAILPGVAGASTIFYFHYEIGGMPPNKNPTTGRGKIYHNEARQDLEEAARMVGAEFGVQVVYNGFRRTIGVYAGDVVESFREACHFANPRLRTPYPATPPDIVIANLYPTVAQPHKHIEFARAVRDGGSAVLIMQHPGGMETFHSAKDHFRAKGMMGYIGMKRSSFAVEHAGQLIVYSAFLQRRDRLRFPERTRFARTWNEVLDHLRRAHTNPRVSVYPYAGIQHIPFELDAGDPA